MKNRWLPVAVGVGVAIFTLLLWATLHREEQAHLEHTIQMHLTRTKHQIEEHTEEVIESLERIAKRWEYRGWMDRAEWEADAKNYVASSPSYQAIEWVDPSFHVRWVVPLKENAAVQGAFLGFDEPRRKALETARDQRKTTLTPELQLRQGGKGFLVCVPIFVGDRFAGVIVGVFQSQRLLDFILRNVATDCGVSVLLGGDEVFFRGDTPRTHQKRWGQEASLNLHETRWQIRLWPSPALLSKEDSATDDVILWTGLFMAVLFGTTIFLAQTARRRAREIGSVNRSLENEITVRRQTELDLQEHNRSAQLQANVGAALNKEATLRGMLQPCAEAIVRHFDAAFARIWTLNEAGDVLELQASAGMYTHLNGPHGRVPVGKLKIGLIALERKPHLTNSVIDDPRVGNQEWAKQEGMVAFAGYPLMVKDRLLGVVAMFARKALSEFTLQSLGSVADQIALGIERKGTEETLRDSEHKHHTLFESSADAIMLLDARGFFDCNHATLKMFGFRDKTGFTACHPSDLSPPRQPDGTDSLSAANRRIAEAFEKGTNRFEWMHQSRSGETFPAEVLLTAFMLGERRVLQATVRDITERKQVEETLRESEARFRSITESAGEAIVSANADGAIITWNKGAQNLFGYTEQEILGGSIALLMPERYRDAHKKGMERFRSTGQARVIGKTVELHGLRKDGTEFPLDLSLSTWQAGQAIFFGAILRDITERKRAAAEMESMHKELMDVSRSAGMAEVATNVLHNVGNVLNSVNVSTALVAEKLRRSKVANLGKATALLGEHAHDLASFLTQDQKGTQLPGYLTSLAQRLAEEQTEILNEIESLTRNIEHIKDIVAMQQSYSKVSGMIESLPVVDMVEDALRMNSAALVRHDVNVIREYVEKPVIVAEKHKVLQILVNLIRNAKYALDDGRRLDKQLTLKVERSGEDRIKISVRDNGVGIAPENLTRIFSHGFTTRKGGHGFGLHGGALAAGELGGTLSAQSDGPGKGATFILELPCRSMEGKDG